MDGAQSSLSQKLILKIAELAQPALTTLISAIAEFFKKIVQLLAWRAQYIR